MFDLIERSTKENENLKKMHGKGMCLWSDGKCYFGKYVDDKKHGFGVFAWEDGRKYEGFWAIGK